MKGLVARVKFCCFRFRFVVFGLSCVALGCGSAASSLKTGTASTAAAAVATSAQPAQGTLSPVVPVTGDVGQPPKPSVESYPTIPPDQIIAEIANAHRWQQSLSNRGSAKEVAEVKTALVNLVTAETDIFSQPAYGSRNKADQLDRKSRALAQISKIWVAEAKGRRASLEEAANRLGDGADDANVVGFSEARYVVDEWKAVSVVGDTAIVQVTAHRELNDNDDATSAKKGGLSKEPAVQTQWTLNRVNGSWLLAERISDGGS